MLVALITTTASLNLLYNPQTPAPAKVSTAKANTYQFVPTAGSLVTGTEQNANSLLAAAAEGVNTGSWKGTLADDNFHWQVTAADSGTPNLNMQLDLGTAKLANANKLVIQTEVDLDSASRTLKIQICDWVSSTSVDASADSECTTGGWRSLMSQTAANADVDIALTTGAPFQWHIYDGYFTTGTTGGTAVSTPLTNFTDSDTEPIRIRYWSDADVVGSGDVAIDFLRANAFVDSIYHPAGAVNLNVSGGALAGTYANAVGIGNSATAQQSVTAGNAVYLTGAGTAGSVADFYLQFKNVKTYTGANTFYFKADYSCSAATAGLDHKFQIYNFNTTAWVDLNSAVIACATGDATHAWAENNITPADFIDESASDEVRVRFLGDLNSTTTLRIDFAYLMIGSTNTDSGACELTWGAGTATNCTNTRDLIGPATPSVFSSGTAEEKSNTVDNDYYALDCPASATAGECAAANIDFPVTVPSDTQVVVDHFAGKFAGDLVGTTNPDLTVQMGIRDYSGTPTSTSGPGGWTLVGATSATATQAYTDSITALAIGTYGMQINPDDHVDTVNNEMNLRLRTTVEGRSLDDSRFEWDFAMVSIGWVVDSSHPTRNYQSAPTGDTLIAGSETARLGLTAPSATVSVNTGGWQATLGDDNIEWTINGANVVGTNYDLQLNFATAKQNGANKLMIQTEFDTDANIAMNVQICDWVSSTSVDAAADAQCTTGGWRSLVSQNASNADVTYTGTTLVPLQWHIFDGYFTTGTTGGSPVSTPLRNFFDATNGVKIRFFSTTQSATAIDVDFVRLQPIIDTVYHPSSVTNQNVSGGALAGTYANAHVVGNSASAQQSVTTADGVYLTGAGTAGSVADYYLSFTNIKTYTGMNTFYFKADYSCSAATAGLDHQFAIYNFTTPGWEDLNSAAIACATSDATHAWAKNNITISDYINGGETRIRFYGDLNSTTTLRLDFAYLVVGSTNADTADCAITFGSGTATNCSNTRDLVGPGTATRFDNPAEDESATMGTGDSNAYYAFDNETTPDTTVEESTSANISFPVTQPTNSSIVGENYAARFSGCGNTGAACGAATLTTQLGFKDYAGFNAAVGGWLQIGGTSASSTLAYTDTITAMGIGAYGQQISPEDYLDTANNKVNLRLRTTTPGTSSQNVTTVWDFAMVSIQWIEIGNTIDIEGSSSVASSTIAVAVDGLLQVGKTATAAGGSCPCAWSITSVFVAGDRPVLVWHDAASDANESSGITVYDGSGNITGMQLTAHTFSVGSVDDQSTDSTDLVKFDNDADEDVMYKFVTTTFTADATSTYSDDTVDILSGDTLTIGGSETALTYNLTVNGTLTSGGATAYTIQGDWVNNGTFNEGTSTVTMNGTTSEDIDSGCSNTDTCTAENFYNLTLNKTDASSANDNLTLLNFGLRVTNTLTLTDGELIQGTLNIRVEGASAVSVSANGTWTNISTGDLKLGGTFVNNGAVTFNSNNGTQCVDAADDIAISSTSGGSVRTWSGSGTETIYNVAVTDMADSSVTAYTSSFTNTTWTAGSCGIAITGTCDQYDQTTDCTDDGANQFRVAVNGSIQAQVDTVVDGTINITGVTAPSTGDIITVFIDGEATDDEEAVAVTKYDGTGDVTGIVLYWRHLSIGSGDNQTLANADIDAYDNSVSADEDIFFEVNGTDDLTVDTLTSYADEELYIVAGNTYRPASAGGGDVNTTHLENDGTITADSNAINVFGNWQNDSTFTNGTSTVTFTSTTTGRTLSGTLTGTTGKFYNLIFNGAAGAWSFSAAVEASNDFQVSNGAVTASNNNLTVGRDFTLDNTAGVTYTAGSSTLNITRHFNDVGGTKFIEDTSTVNQTGTGTITVGTGGDFNNLSIGYSTFVTTFSNNAWDIFGTLTFNGGTVTGGGAYLNVRRTTTGSSIVFASATTLNGTETLYHTTGATSFTYTITGGNYGTWGIVPYAAHNSVTFTLGGNVSASTGFVRLEADDAVTGSAFNTSGSNYSLSVSYLQVAPCTPTRVGPWAIDFNDSTVALSSTTNSLYVGSNCGSHTLDLDTSDVTVNGSVAFVSGTGTIAITPGSSDFTFAPTASQTETYTSNGQSLWNMTINGANSAATLQAAGGGVDVNNNFTITAGTYDVSGSNYNLTIGNNYSNSGTFTAQGGTVFFDAADTGNTLSGTMTGSSAFTKATFNNTGEWTINAAATFTGDMDLQAGTLLNTAQTVTANANVAGTGGAFNFTGTSTFEQRVLTGGLSKNFGTTSGSTAWTFSDLTFSNGCTICAGGTITTQTGGSGGINVSGILRIGKSGDGVSGTTTLNAGNRTWTLSGTGGDPFQILASPAGNLTPSTSTFTYTGNNGGGDTTVQSETYNILIINNGSETFNLEGTTGAFSITITAGTLATGSNTLSSSTSITVNGTLSGTGDVTLTTSLSGTGTVTMSGGTTIITDGTGGNFGTTSGTNNWTFNNLTMKENGDYSGMTVTTQTGGSGTITVTGVLLVGDAGDGTGTTLDAGNRTWILSGTGGNPFQLVGTAPNLVPSTSTFTYTGNNGGGDTTVQSETYNHLTINNGSETYVLEGATSTGIGGDLTITAGTLDVTATPHALTIGGSYSNSGNFDSRTGTVTFNSTATGKTLAGQMTGSSDDFYNLVFDGVAGGWTFNAAVETANDFTVTNGAVTANGNNLTVLRDYTLANTSGVSYVAGTTTVTVDNNWTDLGGKFSAGTSTVTLTGSGTLDHQNAFAFYNLNLAPSGFITTLGTSKSTRVSNDATLNGGTMTGNSSTLEFPSTASNTPLTFNSPTTLNGTGFNIVGYGANSGSVTTTIGAGNYGNWNLFLFASANSAIHNFGGNVTTTGHTRLYAGGAVTGLTLNTQGHSFTSGSFRMGSGGATQTVSANFGASAVTLTDTADTIDTETTGGTYNLDLGSSVVDTKGNVLFAEGSGSITVTPGTSTLKWTHTSGTKTYTPNGQSLYNLELNASGGTVQPTAAVDVNNNFTITAGTYDTVSGSNHALTVGGNYSNSGTFTARNANVTFDAIDTGNTLGGTMTGSSAFYTLTFNGSGGEWTPSAAVTVTDNLIMTNGSLLGTQDITVNKHVRGDNTGLINLTGGTFEQRVSANRDIGGSVTWTFNNLIFSNGGVGGSFTISTYSGHANNMNITGVLQIGKSGDFQSTTLEAGNRTWTLSGTGGDPFQILASPAGNLTPETSTFTFTGNNGGGDTTIQSETYNHLILNNASETYVLEGSTATGIGGDLTITAGTLDVTATPHALTIGGSYSNSGNFNSRTGTVTFSSTATGETLGGQMTGSSDDFYNLVFDGVAGGWTFNAAVDAANDFTVTNGAVVSSNNNLTVTRDFTLANTSGVSYSSGNSTVTVSRHWTDTGLKHVFGTSTVVLNGTGTVTAASSNSDFYNVSIAYSGHTTSLGDYIRLDTGGVITFNGGTVTNLGGHRIYLNSSTSNTPIVFASPTTIGSVPIMVNVNANGITVTVPAGNYGAADIAIAYRNNSTPTSATTQLGGNVTTTGTVHLGTQHSGNTSNFNTQGHSLTASGISFGSCLGFGCTNPVFVNFSTSTVDLGNGGLIVNNSAGSHTLDLGSSSITTTGNVKFVDGTGIITITPGSSTLTWDHTSGTKTYAPNGQSLWNMALNASGGTVQPTAAVDVNNDFTITAGTYDTVSGSNYALTVGGNFSNSGTFTAQNATVTLDGTAEQNVSGTLTSTSAFYNLTITNNSGTSATTCERDSFVPSVDFDSSVQINNNFVATTANTRIEYQDAGVYDFTNINWNGQASGTRIYFRNSATSGQWQLNVTGTQTAVSFVNVSRSDASAGGGDTIDASDGTNVDCTNNDNWNFGTPTFEQSAYRFANNENGTTVNYTGSPSQDSALTVAATGNAFRLRLLLHVGASNVAQNGETFKLQYGEKTAANCTTGVSWGDVSPSSGVIRFKDNATPGDGDNLTTNGGDPTHSGHTIVAQDYEEANNFTNSVAAINAGQDGLWDFSLENNSAVGGKRYCFKAVKSTGTDLDTYTSYPEVIIDEELVFSLDATSKNFGVVQPGDNPTEQSSTVTVTTNAATGYVVYAWSTQAMTKDTHTISDWAGTNASPTSFPNGSFGFGYSTDDSTLTGGTADRFTLGGAKYAGFTHSGPGDPVADRTSGPVASQQNTITYRLAGGVGQQAGTYTTVVVYVVATTF